MIGMKRVRPQFFEEAAVKSAKRWEQLEADPGLAAPWHSLFQQVDSPRHVLSELLQNAEDARATWARCAIVDDEFTFEHNGFDFDASSLGSLCEFAYSNKRKLHTIGFRGIGFKTTFSLGSIVTVETPTLSFQFIKERFTRPVWIDDAEPLAHTRIRVRIGDEKRKAALLQNLKDWLQSPVPLLFFNSIQSLEINGVKVEKEMLGAGPVEGSEWVLLKSEHPFRVLKITADAGPMPDDALADIRQARNEKNFQPAACSIDLILGLPENKIYTVLPTQVMPHLPFSINAPFLQEPSRVHIIDPTFSDLNKWLLKRAGRIAALALAEWVGNSNISIEERIEAYKLLPLATAPSLTPLANAVRSIVTQELGAELSEYCCLIGQDAALYSDDDCADIPCDYVEAWGAETAISLLGCGKAMCVHVSMPDHARRSLAAWGLLAASSKESLKNILGTADTLPRPTTNEALLQLWSAVEGLFDKSQYSWSFESCAYPVVPIVGSDLLHRPKDICRTPVQSELLSSEDSAFLCQTVKIADGSYLNYLEANTAESSAPKEMSKTLRDRFGRAGELLKRCKLEIWPLTQIFKAACRMMFYEASESENRFWLTRIAIKADLSASDADMAFLCRDGSWRRPIQGLIYSDGTHDDLFPEQWVGQFCISKDYDRLFPEETGAIKRWLNSSKSSLRSFPAPRRIRYELGSHEIVKSRAAQRGGTPPDFYGATYTPKFDLNDYDWDKVLISHWTEIAKTDDDVWVRVVSASALAWGSVAKDFSIARIDRPRGAARYTVSDGLRAGWLMRLQTLRCLPDDKLNAPELPHDLLYRTPETESFLNIEKFVHRRLDNSDTRSLLELLGVRGKPHNADKLIQRLRDLAQINQPPVTHVLDVLRTLDGFYGYLDTVGRKALQTAFDTEKLIIDEEGVWQQRSRIYQANDEDLPGIPVIHRELASLGLWDRISVDRSPTFDKVLDWLSSLPSRAEIAPAERKRVTAVLRRSPRMALDSSQHWLSRTAEWIPWKDLRFFVSSRAAEAEGDAPLFQNARRQVADFSMLTAEEIEKLRGHLIPLRDALTYQIDATRSRLCANPEWLKALAIGIMRAKPATDLDDAPGPDSAEMLDQLQAVNLYYSSRHEAEAIRVIPLIEGAQVGTPTTDVRALWEGEAIFTVGAEPKYHRDLVEQIERRFLVKSLKVAVSDCVGRTASFIEGYFANEFSLRPLAEAEKDLGLCAPIPKAEPIWTETAPMVSVTDDNRAVTNGHLAPPIFGADLPIADAFEDVDPISADSIEGLEASDKGEMPITTLTHSDVQERIFEYSHVNIDEITDNDLADLDFNVGDAGRDRAPVRNAPLRSYLVSEGFVYDEAKRIYLRSTDGAKVFKDVGIAIYLQHDRDGEIEAQYWEYASTVTDSIVIPAEIWLYLEQSPQNFSLVALGRDGEPLVLSASTLLRLRTEQRLTLTATAYRIKFTEDWAASLA